MPSGSWAAQAKTKVVAMRAATEAEAEAEEAGLRVTLLARAEEAKAGAMENTGEQEDSQAAADYKIAALQAAANEKAAELQVC